MCTRAGVPEPTSQSTRLNAATSINAKVKYKSVCRYPPPTLWPCYSDNFQMVYFQVSRFHCILFFFRGIFFLMLFYMSEFAVFIYMSIYTKQISTNRKIYANS